MKLRFFSIFVLAGLLLSSCAVEEVPVTEHTILAVMEGDQTRTSVTDEGVFSWSSGDEVWLHTTTGYVVGTLESGAGTASANFKYGPYVGELTGKSVYPHNMGHSISGDELSIVLPASYDLGSSLTNTNAAMYGVDEGGTIRFNHLAGVMRFSFKSAPVGTDKFTITLDKKINGTFTADLTADYPVLETEATAVESEKTVTINFDALTSVTDINLYVPLPLGTYESLALSLSAGEESVWTYSNTVTNTINRKSLLLMPQVSMGGSIGGEIEDGEPSDSQPVYYVDEYGVNHGEGVEIDGVVWAPVNCGYHETDYKFGKYYQWGRKYGQGYTNDEGYLGGYGQDATSFTLSDGGVSLDEGQLSSNASVFYKGNDNGDWLSSQNDKLWNSGTEDAPVKTEYDPCPEGWRVPTSEELSSLIQNKDWKYNPVEGYSFSGSQTYSAAAPQIFLIAADWIKPDGGSANGRGTSGSYWSSSVSGTDASRLVYLEPGDNVCLMHNIDRVYGCSVRCVKEGSQSSGDQLLASSASDLGTDGTANSYIVSKSGTYKFKPVKGNSSTSVGSVSSVEVLWESFGTDVTPNVGDLIKTVNYDAGYVVFATPSSFTRGNAVIAAKDADGNILWSWHIWLTDEPQGQEYYNNAGTMMDRNLGATSATPGDVGALGLHYQWGRKDPFMGSSSISSSTLAVSTITWPSAVASSSATGTVDYAILNPTTFVTASSSSKYDWHYASRDNTLWTTSDKTKSIYDPCPAGWRVPDGGSDGIWSKAGFDDTTYDRTNGCISFSISSPSTTWYPASGYRYGHVGSLEGIGDYGYYWSASPCGNDAYSLSFEHGTVGPSFICSRAYCCSVRCLQESK